MLQTKNVFGSVILVLASVFLLSCPGDTEPVAQEDDPIVVGAIHLGSNDDAGYNQAHHQGLLDMVDQLGGEEKVTLLEFENVPESAEAELKIEQLIQQGAQVIFAQSFGFLDPALNVAAKYPEVYFYHPSGYKLAPNFATYWGNNMEAMYLAGIAAGAATKTGQLGFITAFPIPNILASVNAFQLGAKTVNPDVTTTLVFNNSFVDPIKEAAAVNAMADSGIDVVTGIVDSPITLVRTAESRGIYSVGFHSAALKDLAPEGWLTGVAYTWGDLYTELVQQAISGEFVSQHLRGGIESGYLELAEYGPAVSEETQALIAQAQADIISGDLVIFSGPLSDNKGNVVFAEGEAGGNELLDSTNWLVEGVVGSVE